MAAINRGVVFGIDYYPEQWERNQWQPDIRRMKEMGFREVRLMEFAWSLLQPEPGRFDFSLFDEVIELIARHDMKVVLGTPTATLPLWLYESDPSMVQTASWGERRDWGARREPCFNAPPYLSAARSIVEEVARHYGHNPAVVGWQIDNEPGHEGSDVCICDHCRAAWHRWLERRYTTIEALNREWGTIFWGRTLSQFSQAPVPRHTGTVNLSPGLILDYDRFCSDSVTAFIVMQEGVLRRFAADDQWIATNLYMPPLGTVIDHEEALKCLDYAGYDNYPSWGDMNEPLPYYFITMILAYIRGLKDNRPMIIFEQFSGIQGHRCLGYKPPDAQVVLWTNQAIARGANRLYYFRWRTAPFAQEQICYGIFDTDDAETGRARAIRENIINNSASFDRFAAVPCRADACVLYDMDNLRILRHQYLTKGLYNAPTPWLQLGYPMELARHYAPFVIFNIETDVRTPASVDLSRYRLIALPLYQRADPEFVSRLDAWVRDGGVLVLGWRAGGRDRHNHTIRQELPGLFTEMAGVRIKDFESLNETSVKIRMGLVPARGLVWADLVEPVTARVLARYRDRKKFYRGMACITMNHHGKGTVFYLGTSPDEVGLFFLYRTILKTAGLKPRFLGRGIEMAQRVSEEGADLCILMNHNPKARWVRGKRIPAWGMRIFNK